MQTEAPLCSPVGGTILTGGLRSPVASSCIWLQILQAITGYICILENLKVESDMTNTPRGKKFFLFRIRVLDSLLLLVWNTPQVNKGDIMLLSMSLPNIDWILKFHWHSLYRISINWHFCMTTCACHRTTLWNFKHLKFTPNAVDSGRL